MEKRTIIQPTYNGFSCYMMAPSTFSQKPVRWLQAISRYKATHSAAPNFAYNFYAQQITEQQRADLELSCWRPASNGAETDQREHTKRVIKIS
uniref:Uncharacterized protein n=1 Tax=Candidatus Kentrum sp. FW TaxID=2126338 RepID=A0A450T767_9GAMM|nr:MAG: hypothetical protein BECKFW1821C_GA0114237_100289 [Candidatus Kentron sp. FW]